MTVNLHTLIEQLLDTGLIQFGRFQEGQEFVPFRFTPDYLPAYPKLLSQIAIAARSQIDEYRVDRILAATDSMPFGVALGLETKLSLVYSKGQGAITAYDLVGAYNSGHNALLVATTLAEDQPLQPLIKKAEQVGLNIQGVLTLFNLETQARFTNIPVMTVFSIIEVITHLTNLGRLPPGQAETVYAWSRQIS